MVTRAKRSIADDESRDLACAIARIADGKHGSDVLVLQVGAVKHRRDRGGRSASDFAVMGGFSEVANRLQDRPERVDIASLLNKKDQA